MSEFSENEEMYLKNIFELHYDQPGEIVKTTKLSEKMSISPASITEMVMKLAEREMITHIPYRGFRLTPEGFRLAASIKRRELLLQILLSDIVNFQGDVAEVACKMEHVVGKELEAAIDRLLGYPKTALDGSSIPSIQRDFLEIGIGTLIPIGKLPEGSTALVELIIANEIQLITLRELGISVGLEISNSEGKLTFSGENLDISRELSMKILCRIKSM
ncbi:MAG: hypothetical protein CMB67_04295 [Euryarchaeota archaeon]|nr:hypothetical protein [Euryarchaeota archaeon]